MRRLRRPGTPDAGVYPRGVVVLAKHPLIIVPIVFAQLLATVLFQVSPLSGLSGMYIGAFFAQIVNGFGLGFALVAADLAWRGQRGTLPDLWTSAKRKLGDIVWATLGFNFVIWVATYLGSMLQFPEPLLLALYAVALYFVIYTMPAAVNGGVPGQAALNASVETARSQPIPTAIVTAVFAVTTIVAPELLLPYLMTAIALDVPAIGDSSVAILVIEALVLGISKGYAAVVLAKVYDDASMRGYLRR